MNTKVTYLYRDANNYKIWNECTIEGSITKEQQKQILNSLHEGNFFIPRKVGLPEGRFDKWDSADHIWFEMTEDAFELTEAEPSVSISVFELVNSFISNKDKWEEDIASSIEAAKESVFKEYKERHNQVQMDDFDYLTTFIYKEESSSIDEERFTIGMISNDGATFYISEKYGDLVRASDLLVDSAINIEGKSDYYVLGGYAENGIFFIYDESGNVDKEELKSLFCKNPVYISENMKEMLEELRSLEAIGKTSLNIKVKVASEKKRDSAKENVKVQDNKTEIDII